MVAFGAQWEVQNGTLEMLWYCVVNFDSAMSKTHTPRSLEEVHECFGLVILNVRGVRQH